MKITAILARGHNNVIGADNQLPWYLPADLAFFKRKTIDRHVIMGRKCFQSVGRPLPKRTNIVITRDPFFIATGVIVAHSMVEALQIAKNNGETEAMILGGAQIYLQSMPFWDRLLLTDVDIDVAGDVIFTPPNWKEFSEVWTEAHPADEKNEWAYTFREFERIENFNQPDYYEPPYDEN